MCGYKKSLSYSEKKMALFKNYTIFPKFICLANCYILLLSPLLANPSYPYLFISDFTSETDFVMLLQIE